MSTNLTYTKRNRSISSSQSQYSSNGEVKLRTVLKSRGDHHSRAQDDRYVNPSKRQTTTNLKIDTMKNKMSSSMRINNNSKLSMNNSVHSMKSTSRSIRRQQTLNCQQQLLGKQDFQFIYQNFMAQLHQLEKQADFLIQAKIRKVSKKSRLITLKDKGKDDYTQKIQELINKIRQLKSDDLEKFGKKQQRVRHFIDRKIQILQKLMAESSTQSDVLKKYFFAISAKRSQQKLGKITQNTKNTIKTNPKFFLQPLGRSKTQARQERKALYKQSSNQQDYHAPKQNQYQTFRYRAKGYSANLQPLPRSSYKKDYLIYAAGSGKESPIKNLDSYTVVDKSRVKTSTYSKDYQSMKADLVDYKQLDSYKNKIKDLQVKFMNRNRRQQSKKQFQESKRYMIQQLQMSMHSKMPRPLQIDSKSSMKASKTKTIDLKYALGCTQSKRQYKGYQKEIVSSIKHKRLHNFKYAYKTLANQ